MMPPITFALRALTSLLPRVSEEGAERESVSEVELRRGFETTGVGVDSATAVAFARRILVTCSCLDDHALAEGEWQFVSFPAYLFARSILEGLAEGDFRLFDAGFWIPSEHNAQRQQDVLHHVEALRVAASTSAKPIRQVFVAWAAMVIDGRFLLVQREGVTAGNPESRGKYVFPGGKVAPGDLNATNVKSRLDFFDARAESSCLPEILTVMARALHRELLEELGLSIASITATVPIGENIEYHALEGLGGSHALTRYQIQFFAVTLTLQGRAQLLRTLACHPERFAWFTASELSSRQNGAGKTAFVDALFSLEEADQATLLNPNSFTIGIGDVAPGDDPVDVPFRAGEPFAIGETSRERTVNPALSTNEVGTLLLLAAIRRGEQIEGLQPGLSIAQGTGWLLVDALDVLCELRELANRIRSMDRHWVPIAIEGIAVRLNLARASLVHFSSSAFAMKVSDFARGTQFGIELRRRRIECRLGVSPEQVTDFVVPSMLGTAIYELAAGSNANATSNWDSLKRMRQSIKEECAQVGLRQLLRQVGGLPELAVGEVQIVQKASR